MRRLFPLSLTLATALLAACAEHPSGPAGAAGPASAPAAAPEPPGAVPASAPATPAARADDAAHREALARDVARALAAPAFREWLRRELAVSPVREHKLHFQRLLGRHNGEMLRMLRRDGGGPGAATADDLSRLAIETRPLELYFPVPAHRAAWQGDANVLVATAGRDEEAPVAFDPTGRRQVLDARTPPTTPVLALVPVETDFDAAERAVSPLIDCTDCGGSGGGTGGPTVSPALSDAQGLYVTQARYLSSFEGWLKGDPEFDIHILGRAPGKDSLTTISCSGRESPGAYNYTQRTLNWTGKSLLYTNAQLDAYKAANPGQGLRIVVVEDDDGPCVLKTGQNNFAALLATIELQYPMLTGGLDKLLSGSLLRKYEKYSALRKIVRAVANVFLTNDDLVGNAIDRSVTGESAPMGNWIVKGENGVTNGYLQLEMK